MDTKQLSLMFRLAETLHFGKAAEIENIAQSGLSNQISKLEHELGFRVFERTNRRVSLSAAGEQFIDQAHLMMGRLESTIAECRAIAEQNRHIFTVGFFGDAAGELTHSIFTRFRQANPEIRLIVKELTMTNQVKSLISGIVDAAFMRLPVDDARLEYEIMFDEPRVAAVPASHPLASSRYLSIGQLLDKPFAVAGEGAPSDWASYWALRSELVEPCHVGAFVKSIPESLAAIAYQGAFDTYPLSAARIFQHPGVCYIPLQDATRSELALVTVKGNRSPAVLALKECVRKSLKEDISCLAGAHRR
ncbi:LysR family transcriptional regulator [Vreelandella nigrificans]|uniref:LysR family transcriptional regulator n=1 Tax=Vreelandella nigrificans TaxID=2042704 RepID=A0A2A4HRF1_9GAMM|nr:LysR family transcriptional regulator [Halomonas nigrificans]PCF96979.1 LysR family transcriptional regulator [Halomonas nigrificans]